jgi:hypothetical protein
LMLLILLVTFFSGASFFFDHYRIPTLVVVILLLALTRIEHTYNAPVPAPDEPQFAALTPAEIIEKRIDSPYLIVGCR